jgi:hypothetical protein
VYEGCWIWLGWVDGLDGKWVFKGMQGMWDDCCKLIRNIKKRTE